MHSEVIALIPARRDSQGIPGKNLRLLHGQPLIEHTIDTAISVDKFSRVIISTNDLEIEKIALRRGIEILRRPESLATAVASADSVIEHCIQEKTISASAVITYLQPTSPLRTVIQVRQALELFFEKSPRAVVSVKKASPSIFKAFKIGEDGYMTGLAGSDAPYCGRETVPKLALPNGAIYIFTASEFLTEQKIPRDGLIPFLMDNRSSIDIDTIDDLELAANWSVENE